MIWYKEVDDMGDQTTLEYFSDCEIQEKYDKNNPDY